MRGSKVCTMIGISGMLGSDESGQATLLSSPK